MAEQIYEWLFLADERLIGSGGNGEVALRNCRTTSRVRGIVPPLSAI